MHVREMLPQDLEAVIGLESSVPEAPHWPRSAYESYLNAGHCRKRLYIAEDRGRLLGFVAARLVLDTCELESIVVDVAARRSKVGTALLDRLILWASENGASHVQLEVRAGNTRAITFYLRSHFSRNGLRPSYYRDPEEDAVLMRR